MGDSESLLQQDRSAEFECADAPAGVQRGGGPSAAGQSCGAVDQFRR